MKGIFWNSRGLRDLAKINFLRDITIEKGLDFISLLDTHKRDFIDAMLKEYCRGKEFFGIGSHLEADEEVFCLELTYLFLW
jgi:hypothetical protein